MTETVSQVGEFGLIHRIHELISTRGEHVGDNATVGIGDDCAVFTPRAGVEILVTCDSVVEGRHYLPQYISAFDLGRRCMTLNISDIGAMGGRPLYAIVSLGLKPDTPVTDVESMYMGFLAELGPFHAAILGGNITRSSDAPFIDITLIGEVEQGKAVRRSTANPGDVILVTGYPGQSAAGLDLLLNRGGADDLTDHPLVKAYNTPSHRAKEGYAVAASGFATAMIDTSDGLLGDLGHICSESRVGAWIAEARLPLSAPLEAFAGAMKMKTHEVVLRDSDDYELIITSPPEHGGRIGKIIRELSGVTVTEIGTVTDSRDKIKLTTMGDEQVDLSPSGWDHFKK
ncbi:MAG: thiamine-phosphate kinase [Deltaproteobacteria bacterium]|nr:thiamine-phosphate kinase [Deltaproteobacteria bacterium]